MVEFLVLLNLTGPFRSSSLSDFLKITKNKQKKINIIQLYSSTLVVVSLPISCFKYRT